MEKMNRFIPTQKQSELVDQMIRSSMNQRRNFERRWYDNNFFDDGYHFRYISRTTGKLVDTSDKSQLNLPQRAIPKASRQIRGVANLISSIDPTPVVYPESVTKINFSSPDEYMQALQLSKDIAAKTGHWLKEEWKNQDIKSKMVQMLILTAKHGISFMEVWPDDVEEKIRTEVFDAFDIYILGNYDHLSKVPFIIKSMPEHISRLQANEAFDPEVTASLIPDNKFSASEIKQAYMQTRYGYSPDAEDRGTVVLNECFAKEFLTKDNMDEIKKLSEKTGAMENKNVGDVMIRHTFTAAGQVLLDEYVDLPDYPFVSYTMEPGPLYQTPLIERFIPANKSLDIVTSRIERWANTMVTGTWLKRKGEDFEITNVPGGQVLEYKTTAPVQANMTNVPAGIFDFISLLNQTIEEQGASTSALGRLPEGVKSGVAIESVKATEFDNLRIATDMYKRVAKELAEKMLDLADRYFITPQSVYYLEKGEPQYFDIIGKRGMDLSMDNDISLPNGVVPISNEYRVNIEVESGLGFTMEGKKQTLQQIINFVVPLAQQGLLTMDAVKVIVNQVLSGYQFGATQEVMEALETGTGTAPVTEDQLSQMKVAVAQVLQDLGLAGQANEQKMVDTTKMGVVQAVQDLQGGAPTPQVPSGV